jgi:hypothetical protein
VWLFGPSLRSTTEQPEGAAHLGFHVIDRGLGGLVPVVRGFFLISVQSQRGIFRQSSYLKPTRYTRGIQIYSPLLGFQSQFLLQIVYCDRTRAKPASEHGRSQLPRVLRIGPDRDRSAATLNMFRSAELRYAYEALFSWKRPPFRMSQRSLIRVHRLQTSRMGSSVVDVRLMPWTENTLISNITCLGIGIFVHAQIFVSQAVDMSCRDVVFPHSRHSATQLDIAVGILRIHDG